ncbi:hypothetical protein KAI32_01440 [Candidatus Pacearchaeota archaeon]|nr:hypothetical protein [Candidatus Pacearchaeota archaeon]
MEEGKLIVIAGTDCSGKETQTRKLVERFLRENILCETMSFPRYDTPTGKIVGGPYLGKPEISECWFPDGSDSVDPKVASLYYAADRLAALLKIKSILNSGKHLILDRYVSANMGHQGGKIRDAKEREDFYKFVEKLEHDLLGLPRADLTIFLYMPYLVGMGLKKGRKGKADEHENNPKHLRNAEEAYLQLAEFYNWNKIDCASGKDIDSLKTIDEIHDEVYRTVKMRI